MSDHDRKNSDVWKTIALVFFTLTVVVALWAGGWWWIDHYIKSETDMSALTARGVFGDKFGAINALFAGLAFAGIIVTILLQSRELAHTRRSFEEQSEAVKKQRFDSTFFKLLSLHNEITSHLAVLQGNGRAAFDVFYTRLSLSDPDFLAFRAFQKLERTEVRRIRDLREIPAEYRGKLENEDIANIEEALRHGVAICDNYLDDNLQMHEAKIRSAYTAAASREIDHFSHYFRNLYHLLKFVRESQLIKDHERDHYSKIVRSQLAESELVALFYNSLCKVELSGREQLELGYPKMGKLLVRFDVLQNMSRRSLIHSSHEVIFRNNNGAPNGRA